MNTNQSLQQSLQKIIDEFKNIENHLIIENQFSYPSNCCVKSSDELDEYARYISSISQAD